MIIIEKDRLSKAERAEKVERLKMIRSLLRFETGDERAELIEEKESIESELAV